MTNKQINIVHHHYSGIDDCNTTENIQVILYFVNIVVVLVENILTALLLILISIENGEDYYEADKMCKGSSEVKGYTSLEWKPAGVIKAIFQNNYN